MMKKMMVLCILMLQVFCGRVDAASTLLGTTLDLKAEESTLVEIDQNTGDVVRTIGTLDYVVNGLAYDPTSGILYGSTSVNSPNFHGLITIDLETADVVEIGPGWGGVFPNNAVSQITFDSSGQLYGWDGRGDNLELIDKTNGNLSPFANAGIGDTGESGLDFDLSGTLWFYNGDEGVNAFSSFNIDTMTGSGGTAIASGFDSTLGHHGKFNPDDGLYWGITEVVKSGNAPSIAFFNLEAPGSVLGQIPAPDGLHTIVFILSLIDPVPFVEGEKVKNRFPTQSEFVNKLKWGPSPSDDVVAYRIYRNGTLIAEVPACCLCYNDHNRPECEKSTYAVTAVAEGGAESAPVEVTITLAKNC